MFCLNARIPFLASLAAILFLGTTSAPAQTSRLHVFLVIDKDADFAGADHDQQLMTDIFNEANEGYRRFYGKSWLYDGTITNINNGHTVTADVILDTLAAQRPQISPHDVIVFYYSGHGAIHPKDGHLFTLQSGSNLPRWKLRNALERCNGRLAVILTDCCSARPTARYRPMPPSKVCTLSNWRVLHQLLSSPASGLVDITAATDGDFAYGSPNGSVMTQGFARVLCRPLSELDSSGDNVITWKEFFPHLRRETEDIATSQLGRCQTPQAFNLAYRPQYRRYLIVSNRTAEPLDIHLRYYTLGPGKRWYWYPATGNELRYQLKPGQESYLRDKEFLINASYIRIWAVGQSSAQQWTEHQDRIHWLAPRYGYEGSSLETHRYEFVPAKSKTPITAAR